MYGAAAGFAFGVGDVSEEFAGLGGAEDAAFLEGLADGGKLVGGVVGVDVGNGGRRPIVGG